jgi:hypothetical protein
MTTDAPAPTTPPVDAVTRFVRRYPTFSRLYVPALVTVSVIIELLAPCQ